MLWTVWIMEVFEQTGHRLKCTTVPEINIFSRVLIRQSVISFVGQTLLFKVWKGTSYRRLKPNFRSNSSWLNQCWHNTETDYYILKIFSFQYSWSKSFWNTTGKTASWLLIIFPSILKKKTNDRHKLQNYNWKINIMGFLSSPVADLLSVNRVILISLA